MNSFAFQWSLVLVGVFFVLFLKRAESEINRINSCQWACIITWLEQQCLQNWHRIFWKVCLLLMKMIKVYLGIGAMISVRGSRASSEWHYSFRNRVDFGGLFAWERSAPYMGKDCRKKATQTQFLTRLTCWLRPFMNWELGFSLLLTR